MHRVLRIVVGLAAAVSLAGSTGCGRAPLTIVDDPALHTAAASAEAAVAKVLATRCDAGPTPGSAFVVGPGLLLTAAHVVTGARQVAIALPGTGLAVADVVGLDPSADTALLRTTAELPDALTMTDEQPQAGAPVALLGYPLGGDGLATGQGLITSTNDQVVVNGFDMNRLLTIDVEVAAGNSGGPVLDVSGDVVGMVVARMGGKAWRDGSSQVTVAIPASVLNEHLDSWPDPVAASPCQGDAESLPGPPTIAEQSIDAEPVLTVWLLAAGLNAGQYASSWHLLTPAARLAAGSFEQWRDASAGAEWQSLQVSSAEADGDRASLQIQANRADAQSCTRISLRYELRRVDGVWLIDQLTQTPDGAC